jgi:hypothetical protein
MTDNRNAVGLSIWILLQFFILATMIVMCSLWVMSLLDNNANYLYAILTIISLGLSIITSKLLEHFNKEV